MTVAAGDRRGTVHSSVGTLETVVRSRTPERAAAPTAVPAPSRRARANVELVGRVQGARDRFQQATSEPAFSDFCGTFVTEATGAVPFFLQRPVRTAAAVIAALRLPVYRAQLGEGPGAEIIRWTLTWHVLPGVPVGLTGVGMLQVPERSEDYVAGSSKQTLRRKIRAAEKAGITFRTVDDPAERRALVAQAQHAETVHPDETYRNAEPNVDDLLEHDLWLAAYSRDDRPLLLSVTPTDGEWALLRYFRTLGSGDEYSLSRYLMSRALVEALSARGVRHLVDTYPPLRLPTGLRHFQRMVGFRTVRARVART